MKKEYDFTKGVRGKFFQKGAKLRLPIYLDPNLQKQLEKLAENKREPMGHLVDRLLRKELHLIH